MRRITFARITIDNLSYFTKLDMEVLQELTSEKAFYHTISDFFKRRGYNVVIEFSPITQFYGSKVDLIAFSRKEDVIISIEVKMKNIKKAIAQAASRMTFSDYVYIAFPNKYAKWVLRKYFYELERMGLGLLAFSDTTIEMKSPELSKILNISLKTYVMRRLSQHINVARES